MSKHVVVIGGGVIGAACAHYLADAGWRVTILDRGQFGQACSHGNCGYVCPSHVLPLAMPGAVSAALGTLFVRNSPLRVKPRLSLSHWRWLLAFSRRCNHRDMLEAGHGIQPLLQSSRTLYDDLVHSGIECEWQTRGLLFVFHSKSGMEHYAATDELLRTEFGVPARPFHGDALCELEPAIQPGLGGGWLYETDAHLRSDRLMRSWRTRLIERGVNIREGCDVTGFVREGGKATAAATAAGEVSADAFVLAAGALTPFLNDGLGCRIPIQPGKGYSITTARPARCPVLPMIFEEHRVAVTPFADGYRIGSMMEFVGYDTSIKPKRIRYLRETAARYLHNPIGEPVEEEWFGWRPMTPDSLPLIGPSPAMSNVMIAAGHNMLGLSMAPATGRLVAELLDRREPHLNPFPYRPNRFG
jgi:D-amino-acid dehydrogenase